MHPLSVNAALVLALDALMLNLSHFYLLSLAADNLPLPESQPTIQRLERKGYLLGGRLTGDGQLLYERLLAERGSEPEALSETLSTIKSDMKALKTEKSESFDRWWKTYPASTSWVADNGREFYGGSQRRVQKSKCEKLYHDYLLAGVKAEDMQAALEYELETKKKKSLATGKNHMEYLQLTSTYLNQGTFRAVLEMMADDRQRSQLLATRPKTVDINHLL